MVNLKRNLKRPSDETTTALRKLRRAANEAMRRGPYSVTHKAELPPSGDKHDYLSFSRYWWPNPETDDGLPYIRRDGQTNAAMRARGDRDRIGQLYVDVEALALAYYFFDEPKYADHAAQLLRTWFLDPETKMNPNLNYAQAVPGRSEGRGVGIIDSRGFIVLLDCVAILSSSSALDTDEIDQLKQWFAQYLNWLRTSELGQDERNHENNHGSWYAAQAARIAVFVGDEDFAREIVKHTQEERLAQQFRADGSQPHELKRTKSLHYSLFNLSALSVVARVAESLELDLWHAQTEQAGNLESGLSYLRPYLLDQESWPHQQISRYELSPKINQLLRQASVRYQNPAFARAIQQVDHRDEDYNFAPLVTATYQGGSESKDLPRVTITKNKKPELKKYQLPDISQFTIENIQKRIPAASNGRATIELTKKYSLLDEAFRRERGDDLRKRQGVEDTRTIVVQGGPLTIEQLVEEIDDPSIARKDERTVLLRLPVFIQPGATLIVDGTDAEELRLSTDHGVFIANAGDLFILNTKVTSWSESKGQPTWFSDEEDFRPFISSYIRSKTYLAGSTFEHLGYHAPTAYGLSLSSHPERERGPVTDDWPTGQLVGNTFTGLYYGFYSYEARDVAIIDNTYDESIRYGIDPHDRSTRLVIAKNITRQTRERHGIIGSRGITESFIFKNVSHDNHGSGIMLDRQCHGNVVAENQVFGNGQGIAVYESDNNLIASNTIRNNQKSGIRVRNSVQIDVQQNIVTGNADYGFEIYAKHLDDHKKRESRGDHYQSRVRTALRSNIVTQNQRGCLKGNSIDRMLIHGISTKLPQGNDANATMADSAFDSDDDTNFGNELKPYAPQLRKAFEHEQQVIYRTRN